MKLDSNAAWKQATESISANREVVLVLAGVFFMLPALALAVLLPVPEPEPGMTPRQILALVQSYFVTTLPYMIPITILQAVGGLTILTLFTDRTRPTVAEAIKLATFGLLPFIASQLLLGLGLGLVGGIVIAIVAALRIPVLVALVFGGLFGAAIYLVIRFVLVGPIIAVERTYNPVTALQRSWQLTEGNAGRIALFFLMLAVIAIVITLVVNGVAGALFTLLLGKAGRVLGEVVGSAIGAAITLVFLAVRSAIHRQLAGPSPEAIGTTFD